MVRIEQDNHLKHHVFVDGFERPCPSGILSDVSGWEIRFDLEDKLGVLRMKNRKAALYVDGRHVDTGEPMTEDTAMSTGQGKLLVYAAFLQFVVAFMLIKAQSLGLPELLWPVLAACVGAAGCAFLWTLNRKLSFKLVLCALWTVLVWTILILLCF